MRKRGRWAARLSITAWSRSRRDLATGALVAAADELSDELPGNSPVNEDADPFASAVRCGEEALIAQQNVNLLTPDMAGHCRAAGHHFKRHKRLSPDTERGMSQTISAPLHKAR